MTTYRTVARRPAHPGSRRELAAARRRSRTGRIVVGLALTVVSLAGVALAFLVAMRGGFDLPEPDASLLLASMGAAFGLSTVAGVFLMAAAARD